MSRLWSSTNSDGLVQLRPDSHLRLRNIAERRENEPNAATREQPGRGEAGPSGAGLANSKGERGLDQAPPSFSVTLAGVNPAPITSPPSALTRSMAFMT